MSERDLRSEFGATLLAGELTRAAQLCDELLRRHPGDPLIRFNAACLDARREDAVGALEELEAAVAAGFDDLRGLETDADLSRLRGEARFVALADALRADLDARAAEASRDLPFGSPVALGDLYADDGTPADFAVSVSADAIGLHLLVDAPAGAFPRNPAPWYRGGGLLLTVTAPADDETYDAARAWRFGYGVADAVPVGAVLTLPGRRVDQAVLELAPRLGWDSVTARRVLAADLPWAYLAPYAPPHDLRCGLNVEWVALDGAGRTRRYRLVDDPAGADPAAGRARRHVPLRLAPGGEQPLLHGAVSSTVAGSQPLEIAVTAWSPAAVGGLLEIVVADNDGASVVTSGGTSGRVVVDAGLDHWSRQADLAGLPMGPYRLTATLTLDDGRRLQWRAGLFRFASDWQSSAHDRTKFLPEIERPAIDYRLDLIRTELETRDRRSTPAPLMDTVAEVEELLLRGEASGTLLAPCERVVLALDAGGAGWLPVSLQLPTGDVDAPILLLLDAGGVAGAALQTALHAAAPGEFVTALPTLAGRRGLWTPDSRRDAGAVLDWLAELFPGRPVLAVSVDGTLGEATRLAVDHPGGVKAVREESLPPSAAAAAEAILQWARAR
jgi:hypothetical protein